MTFSTDRYLATGESFHSLSFSFRISVSWISKIVKEVFDSIRKNMLVLMPSPTKETFKSTEIVFRERWNFPNAVGCLDGKHIRVRCPNKTGSLFYNYKNYFSIILFALTDANYKFMAIDVGSFGRGGDAGNFHLLRLSKNLVLGNVYETNSLTCHTQNYCQAQISKHHTSFLVMRRFLC